MARRRNEPIIDKDGNLIAPPEKPELLNECNALRLVGECYERTVSGERSKLTDAQILSTFTYPDGRTRFDMAQPHVRHFENFLGAHAQNVLEIGTFLGGSAVAFAAGNDCKVVTVDDFSENHEQENIGARAKEFIAQCDNIRLIEADARTMSIDDFKERFDLMFIDGPHDEHGTRTITARMLHLMADTCLVMVDDWDGGPGRNGGFPVQKGTLDAFAHYEKHNSRQHKCVAKLHIPGQIGPKPYDFWNGILLALWRIA